jgi:hypothetical protein
MGARPCPNRHHAAAIAARLAVTFAAALAGFAPAAARANDRDPRATPVPASACVEITRPANITPWSSYGWFSLYTGGAYVTLRCPLPLNNVDLGGTTDDNDISKFRVHYRDGDGFGTTARVEVDLKRTAVNAGGLPEGTVVCSWKSNVDGAGATTAAKATKACPHDLAAEAFLSFEVRLQTVDGTYPVDFLGITFP